MFPHRLPHLRQRHLSVLPPRRRRRKTRERRARRGVESEVDNLRVPHVSHDGAREATILVRAAFRGDSQRARIAARPLARPPPRTVRSTPPIAARPRADDPPTPSFSPRVASPLSPSNEFSSSPTSSSSPTPKRFRSTRRFSSSRSVASSSAAASTSATTRAWRWPARREIFPRGSESTHRRFRATSNIKCRGGASDGRRGRRGVHTRVRGDASAARRVRQFEMTPRDVEKTLGERRRDAIRLGEGRLRRRTTSKPFVDRGVVVTGRRGSLDRSMIGSATPKSLRKERQPPPRPAAESVVVVEHGVAEFLVRLDVGDHPRSRGAVLPEHAHARADGRSERRGGDASVVRRTGVGVGRAPIYDAGHAPILRPAGDRARAGRDGAEQPRARLDVFRGGGGVVARAESRVPALARVRRGGLGIVVGTRVHDGTEASGEPRPPPRHPPKPRSRSARASSSHTSATIPSRRSSPAEGGAYRRRAHIGPAPGAGTGSPSGETVSAAVSTGRTRAPTGGGHGVDIARTGSSIAPTRARRRATRVVNGAELDAACEPAVATTKLDVVSSHGRRTRHPSRRRRFSRAAAADTSSRAPR